MKRDMDLVRELLKKLEERPANSTKLNMELEGRDIHEVGEHLKIMEEAGFVEGVSRTRDSVSCVRLTWQGHEFLESTRNDTIWKKAKDLAIKTSGGLSIVALKTAVQVIVTSAVNGSPH